MQCYLTKAVHACVCMCACVYTHVCVHACVRACMYVWVCVHTYVYHPGTQKSATVIVWITLTCEVLFVCDRWTCAVVNNNITIAMATELTFFFIIRLRTTPWLRHWHRARVSWQQTSVRWVAEGNGLKRRGQLLGFILSACQFVSNYFIKLGTMFTNQEIPLAICSNGK